MKGIIKLLLELENDLWEEYKRGSDKRETGILLTEIEDLNSYLAEQWRRISIFQE